MRFQCKRKHESGFCGVIDRRGMTLVESICAVGIIVMLLSLLAPAIMSSRESARRAQCSNNLRQIGIGITNFHTTWGHLPLNNSTFVQLRAELELGELNLSGKGPLLSNTSILRCPSDRYVFPQSEASYFLNHGSSIFPRNGAVDNSRSINLSGEVRYISFREFTDGLSNTALFSEHKQMDSLYTSPKADDRASWASPKSFHPGEEQLLTTFLDGALQNKQLVKIENYSMLSRTSVDNSFYYDHLWSPNKPVVVDVLKANYPFVISPSSLHGNGLNLLLGDGRVEFFSDSVSRPPWQAIGSRNGGEVAAE